MKRAGMARIVCAWIVFQPLLAHAADKAAGKMAEKSSDRSSRIPQSRGGDQPPIRPSRSPIKSSQTQRKAPKGVVARFAQAMRLYDTGKFAEALVAFDALHRAYPAHEPTIIQYAKTLYKLDRIPESYNLFARVNPQYLDPETAYEYGYAFYVQNRFDGALFSFKRVPLEHALYDLASYYGAMSAIRLKKYAEAEDLLDKAVVLPDKLARNKTLYQRHVTSLRQLQEKAELERATADEKKRLTSETTPSKTQGTQPPSAAPAAPSTPAPYAHSGFFGVTRLSKIISSQTNQSSDLHGYSRKNYQSQLGAFAFSQGPMFPLAFKLDTSRQAAIGAQLDLQVSSLTTSGTRERLVATDSSQDIVRNLTERSPNVTHNAGDLGGNIWLEMPLPAAWWLGVDGHLGFTYPNFARGQRYGFRGVTAHLGLMKDGPIPVTAELSGTYDLFVDSETEPVTGNGNVDAAASVKTSFGMLIILSARYAVFDYKLPILPGPDTSTSGTLSATQLFPLGMSLTAGGTAEQQQNNIARELPTYGSASADGQIMTVFAKFKAAPTDWLSLSASHLRSQSNWNVHQPERVEAFKAATSNYSETTEIKGSINFNF